MLAHPLHPIFVHFTVALSFTGIGAYCLSYFILFEKIKKDLGIASLWMIFFAFIAAILTLITGFLQFDAVDHDMISHQAMVNHRNWALATAFALLLCTLLAFKSYIKDQIYGTFLTLFLLILGIMLGITAYKGGTLVYHYGLGVDSTPKLRALQNETSKKAKHENLFEMEHKNQHE